ncbi:unnamed protein product, partial [marine sediment metagenome]
AHSFESSMKSARASYIAGTFPISIPAFYRKYSIEMQKYPVMIAYHATVKSFPSELEAFRKVNELFPSRTALMIDTYDIKQGTKNAIIVANELKQKGQMLLAVVIDSGDLAELTKYCLQKPVSKKQSKDLLQLMEQLSLLLAHLEKRLFPPALPILLH